MDYAPRRIRADTRTCIHTHPHIQDKRNAQTRMYGHVRRLNHGSEQTLKGHRSGQTSSKSGMMGYLVKNPLGQYGSQCTEASYTEAGEASRAFFADLGPWGQILIKRSEMPQSLEPRLSSSIFHIETEISSSGWRHLGLARALSPVANHGLVIEPELRDHPCPAQSHVSGHRKHFAPTAGLLSTARSAGRQSRATKP